MRSPAAILFLFPLLFSNCETTRQVALKEFQSDGCSCFPNGTARRREIYGENIASRTTASTGVEARGKNAVKADLALRDGIKSEGKALCRECGLRWRPPRRNSISPNAVAMGVWLGAVSERVSGE